MRALAAGVLMVAASVLAATGEDETSVAGFTKYERVRVRYEVDDDGRYVETHEWALKVLSDPGIAMANRASVSFSDRMQKVDILEAYTLKRDGHRIDVPSRNFQETTNTGQGKAPPMFSDLKTKTIAFPEVAVGDTVVLSYRLKQKEALFPGHFSFTRWFSPSEVLEDGQISLSAPARLPIYVEATGVEGGEVAASKGRRNWVWSYRNQRIAPPERNAVFSPSDGPLIVASTFKDYGALAAAYEVRAKPKAEPTERVRTLADELTRDLHTPREQARAFAEWVAKNIKYAGNCVGPGSIVPHAAESVLENRMGDCKDHATLLQALLAAKGIPSTQVLVDTHALYALPNVASVDAFNHVITYIPSLDVYVDATSEYTPFGSLPWSVRGKPVVHTADFTGLRKTPVGSYRDERSHAKSVLHLDEKGSADGDTTIELSGGLASNAREWMAYLDPNIEDRVMRAALSAGGYTGTGTFIRDGSGESTDQYRYGAHYHLDGFMAVPGPGAIAIRAPQLGMASIETFLSQVNMPEPTRPFQCTGGSSTEEYTIELPKRVRVDSLPKDVELHSRTASYRARYRLKGSTVTVTREIDDRTPGPVCSPQDYVDFKPFGAAVLRDVRAQIIYR